MDIPAKALVNICIEQGMVCHYKLDSNNQDGTHYVGNRFLIVLNVNPKTDTVLVLVTITSKIDSIERFIKVRSESPDTIVRISPTDFPRLSEESAVNCNRTYETSLSELTQKIDDGGSVFFERLPRSVVSAIVSGVLMSNQVEAGHKKLLI